MKQIQNNTSMIIVFLIIILSSFNSSKAIAQNLFLDAGFAKIEGQVPAFNFSLEDTKGKLIELSDFKKKNVLLFFWTTW